MGKLKPGNVVISGVVNAQTRNLIERIGALTGLTLSSITGEILIAWHEERPVLIAGMTSEELVAKLSKTASVSAKPKKKSRKSPRMIDRTGAATPQMENLSDSGPRAASQ